MFCYTGLWVASTVIAMVYAIQEDSAALGAASVSLNPALKHVAPDYTFEAVRDNGQTLSH